MTELQRLQFAEVLAAWRAAQADVEDSAQRLSVAMLEHSRSELALQALASELRSRKVKANQLMLALCDCLDETRPALLQ